MIDDITAYHHKQSTEDKAICDRLRQIIDSELSKAESKVWHAHPVWFLDGNPVVGYAKLKDSIQLLFWSGQSFVTPGLAPEGKFKAAEARYQSLSDIDEAKLRVWLQESIRIQWDYKNIIKRKGRLERLI